MDAFNLVAKITLDSSEYEKKAQELADEAGGSGGFGGKLLGGFGKVAKVGAGAFGVVGAAAVAAAGAMAKSAVSGYAEYEQLEGGIKKLFGENSPGYKTMMKNAENAYKTAGMSANEYMETATGFSASLIQALGGDTEKAAQVADVAMQAMSDNVNTFGGDIESVKAAFGGFAKQNYTMLDNLKLGYGGTKTEMERLIKDANKYRKAQGKNADLTIDSYADIIEAIQTVQEQQGIAGATAKESMTTIEGSANATKAAWQNVLTAIAGGGDLKKAMSGLTKSLFGAKEGEGLINQVIPRVKAAFEGIADFIGQAAPLLAQKLPELVKAVVPSMITAAGSIIKAVGAALPGLLSALWQSIVATAPALIEAVKTAFSGLGQALGGLLSSIGGWIKDNAGTLLEKGKEIFGNIVSGIGEAIGNIGTTLAGILSKIGSWVTQNYSSIAQKGKDILGYIVEGFIAVVTDIDKGLGKMISSAVTWVTQNYNQILNIGKTLLGYLVEGVIAAVKGIWDGLKNLVSTISSWFTSNSGEIKDFGLDIIDYIKNGISDNIGKIKEGFSSLVANIRTKIASVGTKIKDFGLNIVNKIKDGISSNLGKIKDGFRGLVTKINEKVNSMAGNLKSVGTKIVNGIKAGITGVAGLATKIGNLISDAVKNATSKTYNANVKIATQTGYKKGSEGELHQAKALHKPYLFNKATVFGRYQDRDLVAGEAGPEMLLGVNKLNAMMMTSVQGGMQSAMGQFYDMLKASGAGQNGGSAMLQQEIINVLNQYLPQLANKQVVLDTGVIAGAVAGGVDSALGSTAVYKGRYNA